MYAQCVKKYSTRESLLNLKIMLNIYKICLHMHAYLHDNDYGNEVWFKEATNLSFIVSAVTQFTFALVKHHT